MVTWLAIVLIAVVVCGDINCMHDVQQEMLYITLHAYTAVYIIALGIIDRPFPGSKRVQEMGEEPKKSQVWHG